MVGILAPGDVVEVAGTGAVCRVERMLGAGGQGEVYQGEVDGQPVAVKWYYEHQATDEQRMTLEELVQRGSPDGRFLWPRHIVTAQSKPGFGYVMALREPRYAGITDLLLRRVTPKFKTLATVGVHLSHGFLQLHAKGLCYRDISSGNVFFHPDTGDVLICDNDNVGVDGSSVGVIGTPRFMAPELVRAEAQPSTQTDLYSLAVLLFLLLVNHHPLDGSNESAIHCFDLAAMNRLYGIDPIFIFDPGNASNRPVPGYHDNALAFWPIYPTFLKELFTRAFTGGLHDPDARVRETTWRTALSRLRDSLMYCACGAESFYDGDALRASGGAPVTCWSCQRAVRLPPRIRIGRHVVMLNHDSRLHPHHLDDTASPNFEVVCAEVTAHPTQANVWGLTNRTGEYWTATGPDGSLRDVEPSRSVSLVIGTKIRFGKTEGEVRL